MIILSTLAFSFKKKKRSILIQNRDFGWKKKTCFLFNPFHAGFIISFFGADSLFVGMVIPNHLLLVQLYYCLTQTRVGSLRVYILYRREIKTWKLFYFSLILLSAKGIKGGGMTSALDTCKLYYNDKSYARITSRDERVTPFFYFASSQFIVLQ